MSKLPRVLQFTIELQRIEPRIWRKIQVPSTYSFWDLHVAIQDSMGWLDYHVHAFEWPHGSSRKPVRIALPHNMAPQETLDCATTPISRYFKEVGDCMDYEYDFGDGWSHRVTLDGVLLADLSAQYPKCVDGERACPPEDCGGPYGYSDLVATLAGPKCRERTERVAWLKGHAKNYHPYDPNAFDPKAVVFWDPDERFEMAFASD